MADVPMERVIDAIEKQSSYLFAIDTNVNISQKVSVSCTDASVETALTQMVKGTDVAYRIDASNVVLSAVRKEVSAHPRFVSGKVLDAQGNPVVGAAVIVKGTTVGMSTGADGDYSLQISPSAGNAVLVVNYLGFRPVEVTVGNRTQIDFTLHEESQAVDAVVVTALGIKRSEKALSYNAQQVSSEDISIVNTQIHLTEDTPSFPVMNAVQQPVTLAGLTAEHVRGLHLTDLRIVGARGETVTLHDAE